MDVKEAARIAREHIIDLFADEEVSGIGLEEAVRDQETDQWRVTFGFNRPWEQPGTLGARLGMKAPRAYKVVHIDNDAGRVVALTDRILPVWEKERENEKP